MNSLESLDGDVKMITEVENERSAKGGAEPQKKKLCMSCRGKGMPGGCLECGKDTQLAELQMQTVSVELLENAAIPPQYKTIEWDPEALCVANEKVADRPEFKKYVELLTKCVEQLKRGELPRKSVLIVARRAMGKRIFAFCCMKEAIKHGMSVCSVIDTTQYRRLSVLSAERPYVKPVTESKYSIEEMHSCDLLFVTVDPLSYMNSFKVVEAICDKRSRNGKPTIITSRFNPMEMARQDWEKNPMGLINRGNHSDVYKYPYLIWYQEDNKSI